MTLASQIPTGQRGTGGVHLTAHQGTTKDPAFYLKTVRMGGVVTTPPGVVTTPPQLPLPGVDLTPPGVFLTPPPTDSIEVSAPRPLVDIDTIENPIVDRLVKSKPSDFDPELIARVRGFLHSFRGKLGTDDMGNPFQPGNPPHPPDDKICAELLSLADERRVFHCLRDLFDEANARRDTDKAMRPRSYGWFKYVLLQRIHGITLSQPKKPHTVYARKAKTETPAAPIQQTLEELEDRAPGFKTMAAGKKLK